MLLYFTVENMMMFQLIFVFLFTTEIKATCPKASVTTVKGTKAPRGQICPGQLIFNEEFDTLDPSLWEHDSTHGGANNGEFQWYVNNRANSWVDGGDLFLKPTIAESDRAVHSAAVRSQRGFSFKYGRVEILAQLPVGDWLWPALWMMPTDSTYGTWPASGEIDIMESRGNTDLRSSGGQDLGVKLVGQTLHWGPKWDQDPYGRTHWERTDSAGFNTAKHTFQLDWTPDYIAFGVNGTETGRVTPPAGGFWELGQFSGQNPWRGQSKMAPFDREFYFILNLAVGGTNGYFPDDATNAGGKPWRNNGGNPPVDFWNGRDQWETTWRGNLTALGVDYVKVWAL